MDKKGFGVIMVFLGAGSFLLPLFGLQFRIMALFGSYSWIAALAAIIIGILLVAKGKE